MKAYISKNLFFSIALMASLILLFVFALGGLPRAEFPKVITALVSTFIGASFAFHLNTQKERRKEDESRIGALRIALFILAQQQNSIVGLWRAVAQFKGRKDIGLHMRPIHPPDHSHLRHDLSALSFMLAEEPELLLNISIEDDRFAQALLAVKQQMDFHIKEVQPAFEKLQLNNKTMSMDQVREFIGGRIFDTAKVLAENVIFHLDETRQSLDDIAPKLFIYAKKEFPNEKFLKTSIHLSEKKAEPGDL